MSIKILQLVYSEPVVASYCLPQTYQGQHLRAQMREYFQRQSMRVALSCICRKLLEDLGISLCSHVTAIQNVDSSFKFDASNNLDDLNREADNSPVRCLDQSAEQNMIEAIDKAKRNGDSVGGQFEVIATGLPYGLGSYVHWDRKLHPLIESV